MEPLMTDKDDRGHGICESCGEHTHSKYRVELPLYGQTVPFTRQCEGCGGVHSYRQRQDDAT